MVQIISPHIDDSLLSAGGLVLHLLRKNVQLKMNYVFTVSDWVNPNAIVPNHLPLDAETVTAIRKSEEKVIAERLSYEYSFLDFEDLPIRSKLGLHQNDLHPLIDQITIRLEQCCEDSDLCFFPLGVQHVDHLIISRVGMSLHKRTNKIIFYEDLPYASEFVHWATEFDKVKSSGLIPYIVEIDIDKKIELLKNYTTQMSSKWLSEIKNYSYSLKDNKYYERFWLPPEQVEKLNYLTF